MSPTPHVIVTSINKPNAVLKALAENAVRHGYLFLIVGDKKSPQDFYLKGSTFLSVSDQLKNGFSYSQSCPFNHYARKNIGYITAIVNNSPFILETDDDNFPLESFFQEYSPIITGPVLYDRDWINVYKYFTDLHIWPRGLPLDEVSNAIPAILELPRQTLNCPIQQGLANDNPDVDAIYRLVMPLPVTFNSGITVILGKGSWCPFNSQNTIWWPDAYPLLYLPAYCSFRMTDIWRSFVAQRICWENNWTISFFSPTVYQERNEHNLMKDFEDEIPGYLNNSSIVRLLSDISMRPGVDNIGDNMRLAYAMLAEKGLVKAMELDLLECWLKDIRRCY